MNKEIYNELCSKDLLNSMVIKNRVNNPLFTKGQIIKIILYYTRPFKKGLAKIQLTYKIDQVDKEGPCLKDYKEFLLFFERVIIDERICPLFSKKTHFTKIDLFLKILIYFLL